MAEVGVLGGGISGLTFANFVQNSEVLEKEPVAGGLARSIKKEGYTFDLGSHIIFSRNSKVLEFMLSLLSENKLKHERNTKIFYNGRYVKYPFENGLGNLSLCERWECLRDYLKARRKNGKPNNFSEWMEYRFGRAIKEKYLYPYNRKVWNTPPEHMDTFWVEGRIPQPPVSDLVKASIGLGGEGYTHQLQFYYPKHGGYQAITDALAKKVGGRLKTSFKIGKVAKEKDKFIVQGANGESRNYDFLVSTIHISDFLNSYSHVPSDIFSAAKKLRWNSAYLVMLGIKNPKLNNLHWVYIPDEKILPNRISFPSNYSPNVAPQGHSSLLAEITFHPTDSIAKSNPEKIKQKTIEQLSSLGFFKEEELVFSDIISVPYAYVVYDLNYLENISKVHKFAQDEGITLLGRFSEFAYYNADRCIKSAIEKSKSFSA